MPPFLPRKRLRTQSPDAEHEPEPESSEPKRRNTRKTRGKAVRKEKGKGKAAAAPTRKKTLFDDLDAGTSRRPQGAAKELLKKLGEGEEEESGSEDEEFEDVVAGDAEEDDEDEDEDIEFEDVPHEQSNTIGSSTSAAPTPSGDLELTLTRETRISLVNPHNKKQGRTKIERGIRVATHQMHVQFLMWHNSVRNGWCCDEGVKEVLVGELMKRTSFEKDLKRWRRDSGLEVEDEAEGNVKDKSKKGKGKGKKVESNGNDWGSSARRAAVGTVNTSRGDPLFALLNRLSSYWKQRFTITAPGLRKIGYMTLPCIDDEIKSNRSAYDYRRHGERIADKEAFKMLAKECEGSRDTGAQLFTALLRGLGLEARMVVSLQPVGFAWSKIEEAVERKEKKSRPKEDLESSEEESEEEVKATPKTKSTITRKQKAGPAKNSKSTPKSTNSRKRGTKDTPIDLSENEQDLDNDDDDDEGDEPVLNVTPSQQRKKVHKNYDKDLAPNYWVEVLSPVTNTWVPVNPFAPSNPVATAPELLIWFEPRGAKAEKAKQVMAYIVGFSSDGTAKDVTVRYLKRHMWPGKTKGMRIPVEKVAVYNSRGKVKRYEEYDWFKTVMSGYERRAEQRTAVDDHEEATDLKAVKPEKKEIKEGGETLQTYKQSAEFVLERHFRREEALVPTAESVKTFAVKGKGDATPTEEKVYLRKDVVNCKSAETWHKEGRAPKVGEQPLKRVPYRVSTINRKRELAEAELASGGEKMLQGLYSREQTDWIVPPPIENGVIPKNGFGNMDCYVPSMVPRGAVHIPLRGTVRVCKKLGIDFAEAVTGFEFGARMAIPIISGVVVAEENEEMVMEQWCKDEAERLRKEDEKRTKAALGMWRKFLMGMRIMKRVREEYGDEADENPDVLNPWTNKSTTGTKRGNGDEEASSRRMEQNEEDMAGGFFPDGHDEEEIPQSFFPTRHEDSEDDGGGFIAEQEESGKKPTRHTSETYPTPIPIPANTRTEATPEAAATSASSSKANARGKEKQPVRGRGRPKKVVLPSDDEEELSEIATPEMETVDDDEEHEETTSKTRTPVSSRKRKSIPLPDESPATRTLPKRRAARKSTGTRSQYFEAEEEEE